jgi:hypothetical protein
MRQGRLYYTAVGVLDCQCHFAFCAKMSARRFCAKQIPKIYKKKLIRSQGSSNVDVDTKALAGEGSKRTKKKKNFTYLHEQNNKTTSG